MNLPHFRLLRQFDFPNLPAALCQEVDPEVIPRRAFAIRLDMTDADQKFRQRFWSKVDQRGPDECWPWSAHRVRAGYGLFAVRKGVFMTASRVALALTIGRVLNSGELACHSCDNPPCCNPAHLFAGTAADNAVDCIDKGRGHRAHGEAMPSARLTEERVREIRSLPYRYGLYAELARRYGVSANTIKRIHNGQKWKHVI